jgi:hypothetical protein
MFQASISIIIGDGASAMFWLDSWLLDRPICHTAPNLFRAVTQHRRKCSIKDALYDRRWTRNITGAPTAAVLGEYFCLWDAVELI